MKNLPYSHQHISSRDIKNVVNVLKSDWLTQGPRILEFEKKLASYCGAKYAVVVSSGTAGLHLTYVIAGFKKRDEVITTPNTFVATSNMLMAAGARPVFCDIRPDTYNIDETKIEKLITPRTKAIVPVHFAGHPCEMSVIRAIARRHNLLVIEDACHALGARYKNSKVGSCKYSDMTVFSFHPVKSITTGEGGAVLTNDKKIYERLTLLRNHGIQKNENGKNIMTELGYNYRITDIQAILGISQLTKLDVFVAKRNQIARWYKSILKNSSDILLPVCLANNYSGWHIYVVRTRDPKNRDRLSSFLKKNGIGANFHYPAVYSHPYYQENGYRDVSLKNEEEYQSSCLTLPCYPDLTKKDMQKVCSLINRFFVAL